MRANVLLKDIGIGDEFFPDDLDAVAALSQQREPRLIVPD
jgi:hypothetical protein